MSFSSFPSRPKSYGGIASHDRNRSSMSSCERKTAETNESWDLTKRERARREDWLIPSHLQPKVHGGPREPASTVTEPEHRRFDDPPPPAAWYTCGASCSVVPKRQAAPPPPAPPWAPAVVPHLARTRIKAEKASSLCSTKTPPPFDSSIHPSIPPSIRIKVGRHSHSSSVTLPPLCGDVPLPTNCNCCSDTSPLQVFLLLMGWGPSCTRLFQDRFATFQVQKGAKGLVVAAAMESVHEMVRASSCIYLPPSLLFTVQAVE
ncbi:hypothetical protein BHE74_00005071 [Ensete ventricosum]|nr:hypothetical protein BHE74_00005071 [Ensete ventricosum]